VATPWDRLDPAALAAGQEAALRDQLRHVIGPFSPYWRRRLRELAVDPASIRRVSDLLAIPAVGERDVCPTGDPAEAAGLVVQATENGFAEHSPGPVVRRALLWRLRSSDGYRRVVDAAVRPTSFVFGGLAVRFPVASTRSDIDLMAVAGARLWQVLGLSDADVLASAVPVRASTEHRCLELAALATGTPALFPGDDPHLLAETCRLATVRALAVPTARAADTLAGLADRRVPLSGLRTLLLVGAPSPAERRAARLGLAAAGAPDGVAVLAVHAPSAARLLWGECRDGGDALHSYPDLEVLQLVDPDTGEDLPEPGAPGPAELVLTQLGFRGSALVRWRTGDLVDGPLALGPCPACGRTVPRIPTRALHGGGLVAHVDSGSPGGGLDTDLAVDLRAVCAALAGRADLRDWRVAVGTRQRDGRRQLMVHVAVDGDPSASALGVASDLRAAAGLLPGQLVVTTAEDFRPPEGRPLTRRVVVG
jgi:phenylacetate-CoA ligase